MGNPIAAWTTEHLYFGQLLDLLEKEVAVFHTGERPSYELMLDVVHYMREYSDRVHHPREDAAFACLAKRCSGIDLVLSRLLQEHRVIARAGETLRKLLEEILDGAMVARADVEAAAATYVAYYRNHIATEEKDILSRAGELLTGEDWKAIASAVPAGRDPLFGEHPEERFRALRRRIAFEA